MCAAQGGDRRLDEAVLTDQLHPVLRDCLNVALLADKRIAARQGHELPLPQHLPAALIIIPDPPRSRCKYCLLHNLEMTFRHIKTELIHSSYPNHVRALRNNLMVGASSCQPSGRQEFCTARNTRSGWGIIKVTRASALQIPATPIGDPLGFCG